MRLAPSIIRNRDTRPDGPRRRGLTLVATCAGVGATLSLVSLAPSAVSTVTSAATIAPTAASVRHATARSVVRPAAGAPATRSAAAPATARVGSAAARPAAPAAVSPRTSSGRSAPRMSMTGTSNDGCSGLEAAAGAFLQHFYAAHLETSPGQQVSDATDVDQYTKTHTVLVEHMLAPLVAGGGASADAFMQHFYAAHLETSPGQQVSDATDIDQYAKTHTVLVEHMLAPLVGTDTSSC